MIFVILKLESSARLIKIFLIYLNQILLSSIAG